MKKQTIVFYTTAPHPNGGSEQIWMSAANILLRQKITVHAFIPDWQKLPTMLQDLICSGMQLHKPFLSSYLRDVLLELSRRLNYSYSSVFILRSILWERFIKQKSTTLLLNANCIPHSMGILISLSNSNLKYACLYHLVTESDWPSDERAEELRLALTKAAVVYFVSRQNCEMLERMIGHALSNASIIRNDSRLAAHGVQPWPDEDIWRIAFVGRFNFFHKGLDLLFRVLERPEWRTRQVEFHLFGAGESVDCAHRWIERSKLRNVFLRGHQKDVLAIWQSCHALVLPSRMEGFSLALTEAMSCGRVPIATAVGDAGAVIQDEVNGFIAGSASEAALADALDRAWSQRSRWKEIGLAAARALQDQGDKSAGEILAQALLDL